MTKLQHLFAKCGQSPWLDNLTRPYLRDGPLARMVSDGIRGVTANPTIFTRAIEGSDAYDAQFDALVTSSRTAKARDLRGRAAVAQAALAYQLFHERFSGDRWSRLAALGAHVQRPLWASTSTNNPAYAGTLYVDNLIGPDTVNTLPEATIAAFKDHGQLARTLDADPDDTQETMSRLAAVGIYMDEVGLTFEDQGVASFHQSFQDVLARSTPKPVNS
jgi:transaldolase